MPKSLKEIAEIGRTREGRMSVGDNDHYIWCDFCLYPMPEWTLMCDPAKQRSHVSAIVNARTPHWACCGQCLALIMTGQRVELAKRSIKWDEEMVWDDVKEDVEAVMGVHQTCFDALLGIVPVDVFLPSRRKRWANGEEDL